MEVQGTITIKHSGYQKGLKCLFNENYITFDTIPPRNQEGIKQIKSVEVTPPHFPFLYYKISINLRR